MLRKYNILFLVIFFEIIFISPVLAFENKINPIQMELYEICQFKLGDTVDELSRENYLQRNYVQNQNEKIVNYLAPLKKPEINGIPIYREMDLSFYNNQLYNVFFKFNMENLKISDKLKEYFTTKMGTPIVSVNSYSDRMLTNYIWKNNDYSISLGLGADNGILVFSYIPLETEVNKLVMIEYAHMLKIYPENKKIFENLIENNLEYRNYMKKCIENNPEYKEALIEADVNMTLFK